jgi:hypothetical protein
MVESINSSELVKDDREVARMSNDKMILPMITPRAFRNMIKNSERILENSR